MIRATLAAEAAPITPPPELALPPIDPAAVHLRIREIVDLNGGPAEVAKACGLKLPTLEVWTSGRGLPNSLGLAHLCAGLRVSADWLLFGRVAQ